MTLVVGLSETKPNYFSSVANGYHWVSLSFNHPCHKEAALTYIQQLIKHQEVLERIEKYKANYETKTKKNTSENDQIDKLLGEIATKENADVLLDIFEDIVKKSGAPSLSQKNIPDKD